MNISRLSSIMSFTRFTWILLFHFCVCCSANAIAETAQVNDGVVSGDIIVGDIDTFVFAANAGESAHIRIVDTSGNNFSPMVWLYNPDGTLNQVQDDVTAVAFNCRVSSSYCQLNQTGTYRLVVTDDGNDYAGSYEVSFSSPWMTLHFVHSVKLSQITTHWNI